MKVFWASALVCTGSMFLVANSSYAQTTMLPSIAETLRRREARCSRRPSPSFNSEQYLMARLPPLPQPLTPQQWTAEEARLRKHILDDVAFHGWPSEWVDSAPHFEEVGVIESGHGYRIRKLRYEIVPGFMSTALLYAEPEKISGRVPAILNLLGHEPDGTAVEYEQKRAVSNFAKREAS